MYIPFPQAVLTAGLIATGWLSPKTSMKTSEIISGSIMDFAVPKCIDDDGNQRCSMPFLVERATCHYIEWRTEGYTTHTTAEVKVARSGQMVHYRDWDGKWTPEKGEWLYLDFMPKVPGTGNDTVHFKVTTCD